MKKVTDRHKSSTTETIEEYDNRIINTAFDNIMPCLEGLTNYQIEETLKKVKSFIYTSSVISFEYSQE